MANIEKPASHGSASAADTTTFHMRPHSDFVLKVLHKNFNKGL